MVAVRLMVEQNLHRLLVVSGPGRLDGIVTTMDVLRALAASSEDDQLPALSEAPPGR
jgi:CBS domain-containing protein